MTFKASNHEQVETALYKIVIVAVLLSTLVAVFMYYYLKQEQRIEQTALKSLAASFAAQVVAIKSQWYMEQQPHYLIVTGSDEKNNRSKKQVSLNKAGWVDVPQSNNKKVSDNICQRIWQMVMQQPLSFFNESMSAVLISERNNVITHRCRYIVNNGEYFDYHSDSGRVSQVAKLKM